MGNVVQDGVVRRRAAYCQRKRHIFTDFGRTDTNMIRDKIRNREMTLSSMKRIRLGKYRLGEE